MSLPRKQNRDGDRRRVPHLLTWQPVKGGKVGLPSNGTAEVGKFSRLSAKMVELSLQHAQRDLPLRDTVPAKPKAVPAPSLPNLVAPLHPSLPQGTPHESKAPNYWKEVRCNLDNWLARARVSGSAAVRHLSEHAKPVQKKFAVSNLKSRHGTASHLWTSMGVAALSAVLVVGMIFGVRHYAPTPDTPQHRGQNTSPAIPAMQDISQLRRSSKVDRNSAAAMQHPARSSAAKHAAAKHAPGEHAPGEQGIRKIRRSKDDDYVAKDTYVYYGRKGKPAQ